MAYMRLGDLLVSAGAITPAELERGLELQKGTNDRLGAALIKNRIITENELIEALKMQLGIEFIDLTKVSVPTEMAQVLSKNIAKQYGILPIRVKNDELYLAMSDPLNFFAVEEARKATRKRIVPMIATESALEHAMNTLYGNEGAAIAIEEMKKEAGLTNNYTTDLDAAFVSNELGDDSNSAPTIRLVNSCLERAIAERASDIHFEPRENEMQVRMRIDGMMRNILTIPKELQASVISRIKIMSGLDIAERRIPQDGRFNVTKKEKDLDVRVSTLPTVYGEKIVARLLDKSGANLTPDAIGLKGRDLDKYNSMINCSNGVILIVGPTGSGKSSTMYSMINELNKEEVNLVTLEDPVEYNVNGINQVQINEKTGMTFANGLRSILRQDPDIIAVGEIRDGETADIAMRAAITGHVVLSTIHTNDALGSIERLVDVGVEPYIIAAALRGVISQRLVRKICPKCKRAYKPDKRELMDLNLDPTWDGVTFYRGDGCQECYNTGYKGRTAVFEILPITKELANAISEKKSRREIEELVNSSNFDFITLKNSAMNMVKEGITTSEEVLRVANDEV